MTEEKPATEEKPTTEEKPATEGKPTTEEKPTKGDEPTERTSSQEAEDDVDAVTNQLLKFWQDTGKTLDKGFGEMGNFFRNLGKNTDETEEKIDPSAPNPEAIGTAEGLEQAAATAGAPEEYEDEKLNEYLRTQGPTVVQNGRLSQQVFSSNLDMLQKIVAIAQLIERMVKEIDNLYEAAKKASASNVIQENKKKRTIKLYYEAEQVFVCIHSRMQIMLPIIQHIVNIADNYDPSIIMRGNGYRSLLFVVLCGIDGVELILDSFLRHKYKTASKAEEALSLLRELGVEVMDSLLRALVMAKDLSELYDPHQLFPSNDEQYSKALDYLTEARMIDKKPFYGRLFGFQYQKQTRVVMRLLATFMASYAEGYQSSRNKITQSLHTAWNMSVYTNDPEKRAERIVESLDKGGYRFFRAFWNLPSTTSARFFPVVFGPNLAINRLVTLPGRHKTNKDGVKVRFMSINSNPAMMHFCQTGEFLDTTENSTFAERVLIHFHGGGFIAQDSLAHEIYLRIWAKRFQCPIISVDYSLAPESPYPAAVNDCFDTYHWFLANHEKIGIKPKRVVFAGDSAGGNLVFAVSIKAIMEGAPIPDHIVAMYPALNCQFVPSASRALALFDPLLPMDMLESCFHSYTGGLYMYHAPPQLSPYHAPEETLKKMPAITMLAAGLDPLLDDSIAMSRRLSKLDIPHKIEIVHDLPHGFLQLGEYFGDNGVKAVQRAQDLVYEALQDQENNITGVFGSKSKALDTIPGLPEV
eukprot:Clim_evm98s157 gene=Clim_evmTU98s157